MDFGIQVRVAQKKNATVVSLFADSLCENRFGPRPSEQQ